MESGLGSPLSIRFRYLTRKNEHRAALLAARCSFFRGFFMKIHRKIKSGVFHAFFILDWYKYRNQE
jgi:hypothetical protein